MSGTILDLLFGLEDARSIRSMDVTFASEWASAPAWVFFACVVAMVVAMVSYLKFEPRLAGGRRIWLGLLRGVVLAIVLFVAADPVLEVVYREIPRPLLYLVFDGTESMGIRDKHSAEQATALREAVGMDAPQPAEEPASRVEYLQALLRKSDDNLIEQLAAKCRLRAFAIDRQGIRSIRVSAKADGKPDGEFIADSLTATAPVTPLGQALNDLVAQHKRDNLGGLIIFSDFNKNRGPEPGPAAEKLGRPIYTVGFGPEATKDMAVTVSASPVFKKAEREMIIVTIQQSQLEGHSVPVRVVAQPLNSEGGIDTSRTPRVIGEKSVALRGPRTIVEFPFVPDETGRFQLQVRAEPFQGESVEENNVTTRDINVRDDFMRLLYVAYQPNWEWRFIKEVFHRDKLVGMRGFRTFLHSSDRAVRRSNPLFVPRLDMQRSEFFANDVIFLGDVPNEALSQRFCEMVKEFVGDFGGGLVIISGPVYGPGQLSSTPLADMLPVEIDPKARRRDIRPFKLQLPPAAGSFSFMQLGANDQENRNVWANLDVLPWYQPSRSVHPLGQVLAEHPTDTCEDGKTPQPLIAVRRYGRGEVVFLAFDETWRLRRMHGEKYYRQFWGQMIYRLGLGHSVGSQKRFIVRTDRRRYQVDDELRLLVQALDEEFHPLTRDKLPGGRLQGELILTDVDGKTQPVRDLIIPLAREDRGEFELNMPLLQAGDYRIRVKDAITGEYTEVVFAVTSISAERQSAVRNVSLEQDLARATGGKVFDLTTVSQLPEKLEFSKIEKTSAKIFPLSSTLVCFGLLVLLAITEWALRKWINIP